MKPPITINIFAVLSIAALAGISSCGQKAVTQDVGDTAQRPNILVLMADDAAWKDFGCYGNTAIKTPNIDKLAATGLQFNNAFLTTSSCSPSRTSILAGKYAHSIGTEDMHVPLPDSVRLIPSYLGDGDYFTGNMLKTHYGPNGEKQFHWYGKNVRDFTQFLDSAKTNPFFMWVGFHDPHRPYNTKEYKDPFDPDKVIVPSWMNDDPETRQDLADYYSEIMRLDEQIGWMVAELEKRNLRENTLVIFLSDNGAPFPRAKGSLYDAGIGTPLIFNWPAKISQNRTYDDIVSTIDLAPTVLAAAGIEPPSDMPGKSLMPVIENREGFHRIFAFSERNWHGADEHIRGIRDLEFKFITNEFTDLPFGSPSDIVESPSWLSLRDRRQSGTLTKIQKNLFLYPRPTMELYDLQADPSEMKNLAYHPEYADVVERMRAALEEWQRSTRDVAPHERAKPDKTDRITGESIVAARDGLRQVPFQQMRKK